MTETFGHDCSEILAWIGDPGAGSHGISLSSLCRFRLIALLQGTGRTHHELAELDDAEIGRTEMLPGAVLDRALAVLDRRVLFADAGDAGEALVLLRRAIDQVLVPDVAQGHVVVV